MKKPDYCPEWFDIDLYDNLKDFTRDDLCLALWTRKMNYRVFLSEEERGGITEYNQRSAYAIEWLAMVATEWLKAPPSIEIAKPKKITIRLKLRGILSKS